MENQRAVTFLFILGALFFGVLVRSLVHAVMGYAAVEDPVLAGIVAASTLTGIVGGVVSFFVAMRHEQARTFTDSVVSELKQVTWPTRDETTNNTTIVVTAALFFASLLAVYDFAWAKLTGIFLYTIN